MGLKQADNGSSTVQTPECASFALAAAENAREFELSGFVTILFIHEVWVFMQHANVLMNPYLQRLDRNYGIALLKKRLYWVIAGVLCSYWYTPPLLVRCAWWLASELVPMDSFALR